MNGACPADARLRRSLAGVALLLAVLAAALGPPLRARDAAVAPIALAERIRAREAGLHIIDVRGDAFDAELTVPGAQPAEPDSPAQWPLDAPSLVVYGLDSPTSEAAWRAARAAGAVSVSWLQGGLAGWVLHVLEPALPPPQTAADSAANRRVAELSRYFGGRARLARPGEVIADTVRDAAAVVRNAGRRGCGPGFE